MRALAGLIVAGPLAGGTGHCTVYRAEFSGAAADFYFELRRHSSTWRCISLHAGARSGALVLLGAMLVTGSLTETADAAGYGRWW